MSLHSGFFFSAGFHTQDAGFNTQCLENVSLHSGFFFSAGFNTQEPGEREPAQWLLLQRRL